MAVAMSYTSYQPQHNSQINGDRGREFEESEQDSRLWDEDIVPALRKRLEGESRVLARRMSGQSFVSEDESPPQNPSSWKKNVAPSNSSVFASKPSAIPRPSLSYENGSTSDLGHSNPTYSTPNTPKKRNGGTRERSRTISTPQPYDMEYGSSTSIHERDTTTPTTRTNGHGRDVSITRSRIPRPNTSNISSSPYMTPSPYALDSPSYFPSAPYSQSQERLSDAIPSHTPPVRPSPLNNSTNGIEDKENYPRASMESDKSDHEFEHWYRGDISRSGGVGELRTGKRREMLDIANYGHAPTPPMPSTPLMNLQHDSSSVRGNLRRRASLDSLATGGAGDRGSVFIEDDTIGKAVTEWVIDEMPLTDGEWSGAETPSASSHPHTPMPRSALRQAREGRTTPSAAQPHTQAQPVRATLETKQGQIYGRRPIQGPVVGAPGPSRSFTAPVPTNAKGVPVKSALSQKKRTRTQSTSANANKKAKQQQQPTKKTSAPSLKVERMVVDSIGDGDPDRPLSMSLINAIPTWREPVLKAGAKWDEVILPAVAKRMGLEGYEEVDGSGNRRPRPPEERRLEPAPGTFGYDHSKYRPPRPDEPNLWPPQMDDFGLRPSQPSPIPTPPRIDTPPRTPTNRPPVLTSLPPRADITNGPEPHSPAPFSRYNNRESATSKVAPPSTRQRVQQDIRMETEKENEKQPGCCGGGCVIM